MFVLHECEMEHVQTWLYICISIHYLTLKHLAIWTTPAWCSFHCCSEGCRISSKMVEPPNRDKSSPPKHAQQKWPIRNKAPTKDPKHKKHTLRGKPHGANMRIFNKNMFCSQCIGKNRDPYFSSISTMLIRVTKILKCLHNKGIKMSSGSGDLCPTPDMHKRWSWTVHRPQKIRGRTCSQGAFIFCSLKSSNDLNLHGTFFSQMTSTHQVMTFQADFADDSTSIPVQPVQDVGDFLHTQLSPFTQQLKKVDEEVQEIQVQIPGRQGIPRSKKASWNDMMFMTWVVPLKYISTICTVQTCFFFMWRFHPNLCSIC